MRCRSDTVNLAGSRAEGGGADEDGRAAKYNAHPRISRAQLLAAANCRALIERVYRCADSALFVRGDERRRSVLYSRKDKSI